MFWTATLPALALLGIAFGVGYYMGRDVGREQGRTEVYRRLAKLRKVSR